MKTQVAEKKRFLSWMVENIRFSKREAYWILNYIMNHETILDHVRFVEDVAETPRGIRLSESKGAQEAVELFINGFSFNDPDQIFHEIRINWNQDLYLECAFCGSWRNSDYLGILEDNPFKPWNQQVDEEVVASVNAFIEKQGVEAERQTLIRHINQALENHDTIAFKELSEQLKQFNH